MSCVLVCSCVRGPAALCVGVQAQAQGESANALDAEVPRVLECARVWAGLSFGR